MTSMTKGTPASSQIVWLEDEVERLRAETDTLRRERDEAQARVTAAEHILLCRAETITFLEGERDAANSRLIAAAPDLYSAALNAEEIIAGFIGMYGDSGAGAVLSDLRAELRKARGEAE